MKKVFLQNYPPSQDFSATETVALHSLRESRDIRDGVIPEDTDRLRSLLCFQHGILHYDGLFHQIGRKLPVTVNGCAHYGCIDNRAVW